MINHRFLARRRRRGYALLEVSVSTLLVGVLLVAALRTAGASISGQFKNAQRGRAHHLAQDLMAEILQKAYVEAGGSGLGPESGELSGTSRLAFDDVDDFHDLVDEPPVAFDGTAIVGGAGWKRTVTVAFIQPDDLKASAASDQGVKQVTIIVSFNGQALVTSRAYVTKARQNVPVF